MIYRLRAQQNYTRSYPRSPTNIREMFHRNTRAHKDYENDNVEDDRLDEYYLQQCR